MKLRIAKKVINEMASCRHRTSTIYRALSRLSYDVNGISIRKLMLSRWMFIKAMKTTKGTT